MVSCNPRVQHQMRVRMLSSKVRAKRKPWIIASEELVDLLFFRAVFSELQRREHGIRGVAVADDYKISLEAFQIAMERLFFALGDLDGFDARPYDANGDGCVTWSEFFHVYRKKELRIRLSPWERIYLTFEQPDSCYLAQFISNLILCSIITSSVSFIVSTTAECKLQTAEWCKPLKGIEFCCLMLFIIEYFLRFCTCWAVRPVVGDEAKLLELVVNFEAISQGHPLKRLLAFVLAPSNLVDAAAILPGIASQVVQAEGGAFVILRLIRLTRILRAFKSPALAEAVRVISLTMQKSTQALNILAFNLMLGVVIFGSLMYMAEGGPELNAFGLGGRWSDEVQAFMRPVGWNWDGADWVPVWDRSDFQSIPEACWWAMVTVTTVGYGDKFPTTMLGKIVGVWTMLFSLVILALPVGVISGTFSSVWEDCDLEKKSVEQQLKRDLKFVAHELSRLEPIVMSKLMLIEVWHDATPDQDRQTGRPPPSTFMGEAKVQLDIEPTLPCSRLCTVALSPNSEIARRTIRGKITLQYVWTPSVDPNQPKSSERTTITSTTPCRLSRASGEVLPMEPAGAANARLQGSLRVTLVSADGLINLNTHRQCCSSPYCMVLCYPRRNEEVGLPDTCIWRSPTVRNSLNPNWGVSRTFDFCWNGASKASHGHKGTWPLPVSFLPEPTPEDGPEAQVDEMLAISNDLSAQLQQHKANARLVRLAVRELLHDVCEQIGPPGAKQADAPSQPDAPRSSELGPASSASSTVADHPTTNVGALGPASQGAWLPNCVPAKPQSRGAGGGPGTPGS